ncbi:adenosylcobinamide-GDP ribazoletransferase [Deferribacterales bacterium RsTz2092]|nr:adenosylcobinamide-GDP ribazoletransferase [Deferribacterales bacterium]
MDITKIITRTLAALSFLTIARIRKGKDTYIYDDTADTFAYAGFVIGVPLAVIHLVFGKASPVLMLIYMAVVTGLLHVDGLADTFDGLFSGRGRERSLEIMKDSRIGAMGAGAVVLYFTANFQAFSMLNSSWVLAIVPALSRYAMAKLMSDVPYISKDGIARVFLNNKLSHVQLVPFVLLALIALGVKMTLAFIIVAVVSYRLISSWYVRRLGGITGDMIGALGVTIETLLFLTAGWLS